MNLRKKAENKCDDALREYVRFRDVPFGSLHYTCFVCQKNEQKIYASVGHFRKRRHLATRWFPKNSHLICNDCQGEGNPENESNYARRLDEVYGEGTAEAITILSNRTVHYSLHELNDIADSLTKMING